MYSYSNRKKRLVHLAQLLYLSEHNIKIANIQDRKLVELGGRKDTFWLHSGNKKKLAIFLQSPVQDVPRLLCR